MGFITVTSRLLQLVGPKTLSRRQSAILSQVAPRAWAGIPGLSFLIFYLNLSNIGGRFGVTTIVVQGEHSNQDSRLLTKPFS
jgi:hypothetical protein